MFKLAPYFEALDQLKIQFEFVRCAISPSAFSVRRSEAFFASKRQEDHHKISQNVPLVQQIALDAGLDAETVKDFNRRQVGIVKKKWGPQTRYLYRREFVPDDLNRSELLLLVAIFEGHLQLLYQALVEAEPRRAFSLSDKLVLLKKIFPDNAWDWRRSKFFLETLQEEIARFDHLGFKDRMKFLYKSYKIGADEADVIRGDDLIKRRHSISHCWADRNQFTHVSLHDIQNAHKVFCAIMQRLFTQAQKLYPQNFQ